MQFFDQQVKDFFAVIRKNNRERSLETPHPAATDLCSNDYLCLACHPQITAALQEGIEKYGAGSTASRLIRGHRAVFDELESKYAAWVRAESALFFANGYAANVGCISAICDGSYAAFVDRLSHASLVDGVRLSGAQKIYFRHNDMNHLEDLLAKSTAKKKIIITESVFSMDGDAAPVATLAALKVKYSALLYVDEAHALGIAGESGRGLFDTQADFRMATFGKALGLEGAMLATSAAARRYLVHTARTFVFSTAPLPAIAHAGLSAIDLAAGMNREREKIMVLAEKLRNGVTQTGRSVGGSTTQIVPVICASESEALELAETMHRAGLHIKAIRPPTVKESRLRISLNTAVDQAVVDAIIQVLRVQ